MDKEMYAKAVNAKSAVELKAIAKEYGIELSDEKANEFYERLNVSSNISDQELEQVAGGCVGDPGGDRTFPLGVSCPKPGPVYLGEDGLLHPLGEDEEPHPRYGRWR